MSNEDPMQAAVRARLLGRAAVSGRISLPAVPSMLEDYVAMCADTFATVGRRCSEAEVAHLRTQLEGHLAQAVATSQRSNVVITYEAPADTVLNYQIGTEWWTVEAGYENWPSTRQPPLFGHEPDAKVWDLASEAMHPASHKVLDIGGGTGRNALPLARRGHPVDLVEITPTFAETVRAEAAREGLAVRVIQQDVLATATDELRPDYDLILVSEVTSDFRGTDQLRRLFELADRHLAPGGRLVLNAFLARDGYEPGDAARELGRQLSTSVFTRQEMARAAAGLSLHAVTDERVLDYEQAHLPEGAWPPTGWFVDWASGRDLFGRDGGGSPVDLRWLVYEKPTS